MFKIAKWVIGMTTSLCVASVSEKIVRRLLPTAATKFGKIVGSFGAIAIGVFIGDTVGEYIASGVDITEELIKKDSKPKLTLLK